MSYKEELSKAEKKSLELNLSPRLSNNFPITDDFKSSLDGFCNEHLLGHLMGMFGQGYWGTQCLNIAPQLFVMLQHHNIPCELVYGEVNINGTDEFDTTLEGLIHELKSSSFDSPFAVHVWISVGDDIIIDPTVSSRIHRYYSNDVPQNYIICGSSDSLKKEWMLDYKPMLVGAKYINVTCGIPLEYVSEHQSA